MAEFPDYFSEQSQVYAQFRPEYPGRLYAWLAGLCAESELCWDAATGNGQAALALARHFASVYASDASAQQIAAAQQNPRIRYAVEAAEKTALPDASADLITVAQAIHWLRHDLFYAEVRRVAKPGGVIALWCYGQQVIDPEIDGIISHYYSDVVGAFWPPERKYIESELKTLPFPFTEIAAPHFAIEAQYSLQQLMGYLQSWSSTRLYLKARGENPLLQIESELRRAWGAKPVRAIRWPLYFKVGRVVVNPTSGSSAVTV